ncbi:MAG: hypothetical protein ACI4RG_00800 [Huintestinicola sp.]
MKKAVIMAFTAALLFCGCVEEREPMRQLPPEQFTTQTSSTYTGTTVDFIYVSTSATPRRPTNELEMPDFPEMDDNPFDDSFYELFTGDMGETPDMSFPDITSMDIPRENIPDMGENISETMPSYETADVRFTETPETAVTEVPDETADTAVETVTVGSFISSTGITEAAERVTVPPETSYETDSVSETYPSAESFDINDYMPSEFDYPEFSSFDINGLLQP